MGPQRSAAIVQRLDLNAVLLALVACGPLPFRDFGGTLIRARCEGVKESHSILYVLISLRSALHASFLQGKFVAKQTSGGSGAPGIACRFGMKRPLFDEKRGGATKRAACLREPSRGRSVRIDKNQ